MSVTRDHGGVVETGKWLVGLCLGQSSYQHGLALVARALQEALPILETGEHLTSFLTFRPRPVSLPDKPYPDDFHPTA